VFGRTFGLERDEVAIYWRRLHNVEPCNVYASPNIIWMMKSRRMRWARHVSCMGEIKNANNILVGNPKRPLRRPRRVWEDNIRMEGKQGERVWTGFVWLRIWTSGGPL
jgi:hypothetical protein